MSTVQDSSQADSAAEITCHEEAEINRPSSTTKRVLRKRRPTFSPHQNKHRISKKLTPLTQPAPIPLDTLHDDIQTAKDHLIVHIDDKITQTKNSMRALITEKCNHFETQIQKLHSLIADLQSENTQLKKENQSIKTQLGTLQSNVKKTKSTTSPVTQTDTQHIQDKHHQSNNSFTTQQSPDQPAPWDPPSQASDSSSPDNPSPPVTALHPDVPSHDSSYGVSTYNKFAPLDTDSSPPTSLSSQDTSTTVRTNRQTSTPIHIHKNTVSVADKTTILLIGDSVLRNIKTHNFATPPEVVQKICTPGLTVSELCEWLSAAPTNTAINGVTVHVGVNSCKNGPVTVTAWGDLITQCTTAFPRATLRLSSIIPARGWHNLNNTILPSNRNLAKVCKDRDINFIDNDKIFTAKSGAPRLDLYRDAIHPSAKGTAQLAGSLMHGQPSSQGTAVPHRRPTAPSRNPAVPDGRPYRSAHRHHSDPFPHRVPHPPPPRSTYPSPPPPHYNHPPPPHSTRHYPPLPIKRRPLLPTPASSTVPPPHTSTDVPPPPSFTSELSNHGPADSAAATSDSISTKPVSRPPPLSPPVDQPQVAPYHPAGLLPSRPLFAAAPMTRGLLHPLAVQFLNSMATQLYPQHLAY